MQQVCTEINLSLYMCENNLSFETLSASHQSRKFEMLFMNKYISRRMRHREKKKSEVVKITAILIFSCIELGLFCTSF